MLQVMWPPVQASFQDSTFASAAHISKLRCPHDSIREKDLQARAGPLDESQVLWTFSDKWGIAES